MKQKKLKLLKDGALFTKAANKKSAVYSVQKKEKGIVICTAEQSGRTYNLSGDLLVYPV